jgi:hypothetical protein
MTHNLQLHRPTHTSITPYAAKTYKNNKNFTAEAAIKAEKKKYPPKSNPPIPDYES